MASKPAVVMASVAARIGLLGNPSDGYHGQCISLPVQNWRATARLLPNEDRWDFGLTVEMPDESHPLDFDSLESLTRDARADPDAWLGGDGMRRIVVATGVQFQEECVDSSWAERAGGFRLMVDTNIPRQCGFAGSSAIETAVMRCLLTHHGLGQSLPPREVANMVLRVETDVLGMVAGLQDRLPQAYNEMLHMDFRKDLMWGRGWGEYARMDVANLPQMWLAWGPQGEASDAIHAELPGRWQAGEPEMVRIIGELAALAGEGRTCIPAQDHVRLWRLMDANFELRRELFGDDALGETLTAVRLARTLGTCAKQTGSGGAICGIVPDIEDFDARAEEAFKEMGWAYARLQV